MKGNEERYKERKEDVSEDDHQQSHPPNHGVWLWNHRRYCWLLCWNHKISKLHTRVITKAVTTTNELSKEKINAEDELQNFRTATRASKRKAEVSSKIMKMYFNQKEPFRIACVLKISRNRVYREVEQAKRNLIVLKYERREREKLKRKIWVDVKTIIEEFWDERENIYFTIDDIIKHLSKKVDNNEVPSGTYIGHYLKN